MRKAFVLMKAMPPTTGHRDLIRFAMNLAAKVIVIVDTASGEPMVQERLGALVEHFEYQDQVQFVHLWNDMEDPEAPGFWQYWHGVLQGTGFHQGDILVGSEPYCKTVADTIGMQWYPYDPARQLNAARGTTVRRNPIGNWDDVLPEFRSHLTTRVTIFGGESCGKTTLANVLGNQVYALRSHVLPEWARPFLENDENVINVESMTAIWHGQRALQEMDWSDRPLIIQDTDLYSTWGYWAYWENHIDWARAARIGLDYADRRLPAGSCPEGLRNDAKRLKSDLYIICPSAIPFEPDPLRYGGDKREIEDRVWINFASWAGLNYRVLGDDPKGWKWEAARFIDDELAKKKALITYDRPHQ